MKNRILNLGTIRDYILKEFPDLLWWDGFHKHEQFNSKHSYKHRQGMPNEIRIEFDSEDTNQNWVNLNLTAVKLNKIKYSFAICSVDGGRSPHIHIYDLDELETLDYGQRTEYRNQFLTKVCPKDSNPDRGLCEEKHLCALEFVNHFKYNKPKELLCYFWNGRNMGIDFDIKLEILHEKKGRQKIITKDKPLKFGDMITKKPFDLLKGKLKFESVLDKYNIEYKGTMALCPFHADGNYSLSFSNDKGLWNCFGCDSQGDIITLIRRLEDD